MSRVTIRRPSDRLVTAGNPIVRAILRSPLHGMMSKGLCLLSVTGRKTGRVVTFPVGYARMDEALFIVSDHTWYKNLAKNPEVEVLLAGKRTTMRGEVIEYPAEVVQLTRRLVAHTGGWKKASRFGLGWDGQDDPTDEELAPALEKRVIVRLRP